MRKIWRYWTAKEIDRLEVMRLDSWPVKAIAKALGRTTGSIAAKLWQHRDFVKVSPIAAKYLPYVAQEHTNRDVAQRLNVTVSMVGKAKTQLRKRGYEISPSLGRSSPRGTRWAATGVAIGSDKLPTVAPKRKCRACIKALERITTGRSK